MTDIDTDIYQTILDKLRADYPHEIALDIREYGTIPVEPDELLNKDILKGQFAVLPARPHGKVHYIFETDEDLQAFKNYANLL